VKITLRYLIIIGFFILSLSGIQTPVKAAGPVSVDSLINKLSQEKVDSVRIELLLNIAAFYRQSDIPRALSFANQALDLINAEPTSALKGDVLNFMGDLCFQGGLMDRSADYFNQSLAYYKTVNAELAVALSYMNIGAIYIHLEEYELSRQQHETSLSLLKAYEKKQGDSDKSAYFLNIYNNLSIIYRELGDYEKANQYIQLGLGVAEGISHYNTPLLYNNLGLLLMKQRQWHKAEAAFLKSVELRKPQADLQGMANTYNHLGNLYRETGDFSSALTYLNQAYTYAQEVGAVQSIAQAAENLYEVYEHIGLADSALHYLSQAREYEKQIKASEAKSALLKSQLEEEFEQREKAQQSIALRYRLSLMALVVFLLVAGGFSYNFFTRQKHKLSAEKEALTKVMQAEQETLKTQLEHQEKQLAFTALQQMQNNEILEGVIEKISVRNPRDSAKDIIYDLEKTMDEQSWKAFEIHFMQVNSGFFDRLQQLHPTLTPNERKLCAFLRMNLSTKEISSITGQTTDSINKARIRLRKKLNLTHTEIGLTEYVAGV
jgi:tetratricopeptide (TPR) repeat protein